METLNLSKHYQLSENQAGIVSGIEDINVSIDNILNTPKGSDIVRPKFGSNHYNCTDLPADEAVNCAIREVFSAIEEFERRITPIKIAIKYQENGVLIQVEYKILENSDEQIDKNTINFSSFIPAKEFILWI